MTSVFAGHIVLAGPIGVGKTPIAEIIAERLGIEHILLDAADECRRKVGWREEEYLRLLSQFGYLAAFTYNARFSVPLIQCLTSEYPCAVLDCGGDDLVGWTDEQRIEIKEGLAALGISHVAGILPFRSIAKTRSYFAAQPHRSKIDELLLQNPSYWQLANKIFYTKGLALEPVAEAILKWVCDPTTR